MSKIRKNDEVIVIAGKDKNKKGKVLEVLPSGKVIVSDINIAKKHTKPNPNKNIVGGIVSKVMPIDISNVAIFNSSTNKKDRVGFMINENGKKVRIYKSTRKVID